MSMRLLICGAFWSHFRRFCVCLCHETLWLINYCAQLKRTVTFFLKFLAASEDFKLWSTEESLWLERRMRTPISPISPRQTVYPNHRQRVSLRLGPDNGGGIGGQHRWTTDSEIVITMFWYSKTWRFGCLFNRMSESAHLCPGEILKNAFTPQTPFFTHYPWG